MNALATNLELHLDSIKNAKTNWCFFLAIADLVKTVKSISQIGDEFDAIEKSLFDANWDDEINWYVQDVNEVEIWKKLLFIYRIIYFGEQWEVDLRCDRSNQDQCMKWDIVKTALSEMNLLKENKTTDYRYVFRREEYEPQVEHFIKLLLNKKVVSSQVNDESERIKSRLIKRITFKTLEHDTSNIEFVINSDFNEIYKTKNKKNWHYMYTLAKTKFLRLNTSREAKLFKDYFNSDSDNKLFGDKRFERRAILCTEGGSVIKAVEDVTLEVVTSQVWAKYIKALHK